MKKLFLISLLFISGCGLSKSSNEVIGYVVNCSSGLSYGDCGVATILGENRYVIDKTTSIVLTVPQVEGVPVQKYTNCAILDEANWTCEFKDGSGKLGFSKGVEFLYPSTIDSMRYVTKGQYENAKTRHSLE